MTKTMALTIADRRHDHPVRQWKIRLDPAHLSLRKQKQISHGDSPSNIALNQPSTPSATDLMGPEPR
jgi:hypothetical protein